MATSSIFQNILVKDKRSISRLLNALEKSKTTSAKVVDYSRPVEVIEDAETIRKIFGEQENDGIQDPHN